MRWSALFSLGAHESTTTKGVQMMEWARKAALDSSKALGLLEDEQRGKAAAKEALEGERCLAQGTVQLALDAMAKSCGAGGVEALRVFADVGALPLLGKAEREFHTLAMPRVGGKGLKELLDQL